MPLIVILFIYLIFAQEGKKAILFSGLGSVVGFVVSFVAAALSSNGYYYGNAAGLLLSGTNGQGFGKLGTIIYARYDIILLVASVIAIIVLLISYLISVRNVKPLALLNKLALPRWAVAIATVTLMALIVYRWIAISSGDATINVGNYALDYRGKGILASLFHLTFAAYAEITGWVLMLVIAINLFYVKRKFSEVEMVMVGIFIYTILIYSCVLRLEIYKGFAWLRYITPYVPIIIVLGSYYLDRLKRRLRTIIIAVSIVFILPFSYLVITNTDMTTVESSALHKIIAQVNSMPDDSVIMMDEATTMRLYLPLEATTDKMIIPSFLSDDTINSLQIELSDKRFFNIYISGGSETNDDTIAVIENYVKFFPHPRSPYSYVMPLKASLGRADIKVDKTGDLLTALSKSKQLMFIPRYQAFIHDFWGIENDFAWSKNKSSFTLPLSSDVGQTITISYRQYIPAYVFDNGNELKCTIIYEPTGETIYLGTINSTNYNGIISFEMLKEQMVDSTTHTFTLETDTWNPVNHGAEDGRDLGLAIERISWES
jgi:hypothetical protein